MRGFIRRLPKDLIVQYFCPWVQDIFSSGGLCTYLQRRLFRSSNVIRMVLCRNFRLFFSFKDVGDFYSSLNSMECAVRLNKLSPRPWFIRQGPFTFRDNYNRFLKGCRMSTSRANRAYNFQGATRLSNRFLNSFCFVGEVEGIQVLCMSFMNDVRGGRYVILCNVISPLFRFTFAWRDPNEVIKMTRMGGIGTLLKGFQGGIILCTTKRMRRVTPFTIFFRYTNSST